MKSSVIGIVFSSDHKQVLLVKRCDVPVWIFPGGGVEDGESPEEAVVREVQEETGLAVVISRKVGEYTPVNRLSNYTHVYECQVKDGTLSTSEETRDLGFFAFSELPYPFLHVHRYWLDDALIFSDQVLKKQVPGTTWFLFFKYLMKHPILMGRYLLTWVGLPINTSPEK